MVEFKLPQWLGLSFRVVGFILAKHNLNQGGQLFQTGTMIFEDGKSYPEDRFQLILRLFEKMDVIRRRDVEEALGIGTTHAVNTLKEMLDKKLLIRLGSGKHTRYIKNPSLK